MIVPPAAAGGSAFEMAAAGGSAFEMANSATICCLL